MSDAPRPVLLMDIDGVVILGRDAHCSNWAADLQRDLGFDKAALRDHFFRPYWADIVTGREKLMPRLSDALKAIGADTAPEALRDYWFANHAHPNAELLTWLATMRAAGYRVMFASNQEHERATYLMQTAGLNAYSDGIYYSAAIGAAKPDATYYTHIQKTEARASQELVLIDDTITNVTAAQHAGWRAIHYTGQSPDQLTKALVNGD